MSKKSEAIEKIYEERTKFVIIGLTGRTGSGCSTVAEILTQDINEINLPDPNESNFTSNGNEDNGNEKRRYKIIHNYINKNWKPFYKIVVTDIITLFILENNLEDFVEFISKFFKETDKNNNEKKKKFPKEIEDNYKKISKKRKEYRKKIDDIEKREIKIKQTDIDEFYNFYFKELSEFTKRLKEAIDEVYPQLGYTKIYQKIGDNIRSSGEALKEKFAPDKIYEFANKINRFVKLIRQKADQKRAFLFCTLAVLRGTKPLGLCLLWIRHGLLQNSAMIVIDAIRNPFEAFFFKDRYSAFYLVSVNTPDDVRTERLRKNRKLLNDQQIKLIDEKEYPKKLKDDKVFISQNIQKCIEISDIHLTNPQLGEHDKSRLKKQLAHYLALIIHPGLVTPTPIERCMQIAYAAKLNSGCISRQVGAVITDQDYSIKAVGWNDTPAGQVPCLLRNAENLMRNDDKQAFSDYENDNSKFRDVMKITYQHNNANLEQQLNGRNISFCFKDVKNSIEKEKNQVHTRSLHAEENAFLQISKYGGEGIKGGILFTTASPCELCAKKAYQLGIKRVIYIDPYPGIANNHILKSGSKDSRPEMELFHGAIGKAYHQLYQPLLAFKDELSMLIDINYSKAARMIEAEQQNLAQVADEIQALIEKLSQNNPPSTNKEKMTVVAEAVDQIESNPTLKARVINALKAGGTETLKEAIDHPLVNILMATIEGWQEAEAE